MNNLKMPSVSSSVVWAGQEQQTQRHTSAKSVGQLFQEFIRFYSDSIDWEAEAISVRFGQRQPPSTSLPTHKIERSKGSLATAPAIEDPFLPNQNVALCLTVDGFDRLDEELRRAKALIEGGNYLTTLLCPWTPPEQKPSITDARNNDPENDEEDEDVDFEDAGKRTLMETFSQQRPGADMMQETLAAPPGLGALAEISSEDLQQADRSSPKTQHKAGSAAKCSRAAALPNSCGSPWQPSLGKVVEHGGECHPWRRRQLAKDSSRFNIPTQ
jgi:hypothetical protein